jgi:hypothetical protein
MILFAAKAAEEHFKDHWLKHWARAHSDRLARSKTDWGRRMAVSGLFGDIEKIVEELPQYERK